jgi:hypothetical protein
MSRKLKFIGIILALFLVIGMVAGCAGTPTQNRLMTADTFNSIYEQYLDSYDRQSGTTQQKWKVEIDPLFAEASAAMGAYTAITDPSSSDAQKQLEIYKAAKDQAVRLLFTYGIKIKEE